MSDAIDFGDIPKVEPVNFGDIPKIAPQSRLEQAVSAAGGPTEVAIDLAIGAFKQPGRLIQMIPGVTWATDKLFGLAPGGSAQSMQSANTAQTIGGLGADVAEMAAGGLATPADPALFPTTQSLADTVGPKVGEVSQYALRGARQALMGKGPITTEKIGLAVGKYGVKAVKLMAAALGAHAAWDAWESIK